MPDDAELFAIKDRAAERFLAIPGVTAVGLGGRERAGRPTGEVVIKVFVADKRRPHEVSPDELIPPEFEGVPTDVVPMGRLELTQGPPLGKPTVPQVNVDLSRQRPLVAGCGVQNELTGALLGTLGCFLRHTSDTNKVYLLTNFHIAGLAVGTGKSSTVGVTKVGQPRGVDSVTKCCSEIVGKYAGGAFDSSRDAGIAQLDAGMQWKAVILEIGPVRGTHTVTPAEATTQTYAVRKRGVRSGLTGGTVHAIGCTVPTNLGTITNAIIVTPNPDPGQPPGTDVFFAQSGDSGSAVVNDANEIVGLHFSSSPPPNSRSAAIPIQVVLDRFQAVEALSLAVATATDTNTVNTVPGAAMVRVPPELVPALTGQEAPAIARSGASATAAELSPVVVPATVPWLPGVEPPSPLLLHRLQEDLDRSVTGRALITLWLGHQRELTDLVEGNRRVAATWHSNGGPALMQLFVRMLSQPKLALPTTVHGRTLADCLDRITAAFTRFASPRLWLELSRVRAALPDLAGLTYPQIVTALGSS